MYDRQPMVINACPTSSMRSHKWRHMLNIPERILDLLLRYMKEAKVPIGSVDSKGKMKEPGIVSDYKVRTQANVYYFMQLEKYLPKWPFPLHPKIIHRRKYTPIGLLYD